MIDIEKDTDRKGNAGYEPGDVNARRIFLYIILAIIILVLILVALKNYFKYAADQEEYEMVLKPQSEPLLELRQEDQRILNSYGIADSAAGTYRIPIDSSMQIMIREAGRNDSAKK